jgi:hypothetical protein
MRLVFFNRNSWTSLLLLMTFGLISAASANNNCKATSIGPNAFEIKTGSRTITLIGWRHSSNKEETKAVRLLENAHSYAQKGQCSDAENAIKKSNSSSDDTRNFITEATRVLTLIKNTTPVASNTKLGIEASESESIDYKEEWDTRIQIINKIKNLCPSIPALTLKDLTLRLVTPEYIHATETNSISKIEGIESFDLRMEAIKYGKIVSQASKDFAQIDEEFADPKIEALFDKVIDEVKEPQITDSQIEKIVSDLKKSDNQNRMRNMLKALQGLRRTSIERNTAMAERLMKNTDNYTVVLGLSHIQDLKNKLEAMCTSP